MWKGAIHDRSSSGSSAHTAEYNSSARARRRARLSQGRQRGWSLANSQAVIVLARGNRGIGGSIVSSVSLFIALTLFPQPPDRAKAMSVWGFVGSGGATIGVILGGLLTQGLNWHWIFLVNVPIGRWRCCSLCRCCPKWPGPAWVRGWTSAGP
jgi:MFS family permease